MTSAERAIRKARKSIVRVEREKHIKEFRERKRRRQVARQGTSVRVTNDPLYANLRDYYPMMWCETGNHAVRSNFMHTATICTACKAGHKREA